MYDIPLYGFCKVRMMVLLCFDFRILRLCCLGGICAPTGLSLPAWLLQGRNRSPLQEESLRAIAFSRGSFRAFLLSVSSERRFPRGLENRLLPGFEGPGPAIAFGYPYQEFSQMSDTDLHDADAPASDGEAALRSNAEAVAYVNAVSAAVRRPANLIKPFDSQRTGDERILILCEGEKTEPAYLKAFITQFGLPGDPKGLQTPLAIAKWAVGEIRYASHVGASAGKGKRPYTEVWCVFDRDTHADFDAALDFLRTEPNVHAVPSNPCFELWLLHHFTTPRRKAYLGKGTPVGKPVVTLEQTEDGNLRETVVTVYAPANPSELCLEELKKHWPEYKKTLATPMKDFRGRLSAALKADLPVSVRQTSIAGCWTLVPHLLLRLMLLKFDSKETASLLGIPCESLRTAKTSKSSVMTVEAGFPAVSVADGGKAP